MGSKTGKQKRKPGRPKKPGPHTASGRPTRSKTPAGILRVIDPARDRIDRDPTATVRAARCRRYGLTEREALDPMAGYAVGRLTLAGHLTKRQHDAAMAWLAIRNAWLKSIDAKSVFRAQAPDAVSSQTHEEFCELAERRWQTVLGVIADEARKPGIGWRGRYEAAMRIIERLTVDGDDEDADRAGVLAKSIAPVLDRLAEHFQAEDAEKSSGGVDRRKDTPPISAST